MERSDGTGVRQRVPAPLLTTPDRDVERRAQDHVVHRRRDFSERFEEPRPDDAVDDDEIAAPGIALRGLRQHVEHDRVLVVGLGQVGLDRAVLDEMPEIVAVKMDLRRAGQPGKRLRRRGFAGPGRPRQYQYLARSVHRSRHAIFARKLSSRAVAAP